MLSTYVKPGWKQWLKLNRLIPVITIMGAGLAMSLSTIGIIQLTAADNIIVALLALLAIDALKERLDILERIEEKLFSQSQLGLIKRDKLPKVHDQAGKASEICIISPAMATLISRYPTFFEEKIRENCKMQIILLNPEDEQAIRTWSYVVSRTTTTKSKITDTLQTLEEIIGFCGVENRCEVRFSKVFIPFSMFAADLHNDSGSMVVEYHGYRAADDRRPCFFISRQENALWFDEYKEQFDRAWREALEWKPSIKQ